MTFCNQKTVLIAPLDWGLGHATRCIPMIEELQLLNCTVIIAAEKATLKILTEAFPTIQALPLHGYRVHYSRTKYFFFFNLLLQIPKTLLRIYIEHNWLKKVVKKYKVDAIISDNRFGLYHHQVPCVYITHQLSIQTGNHILDKLVQKIHFNSIKKFTHCWVPDFEDRENNMAGALSHADNIPSNVTYIGCLSRFKKDSVAAKKPYSIVAVISGPEPQRTIFEKILLAQLHHFKGKSMLVRGLPNQGDKISLMQNGNLTIKNHLSMQDLNATILQADWVIARSGYTTVMDLVKIGQRAILVPTPGQTEQEYLADYLYKKQLFFIASQHDFDVAAAIQGAKLYQLQPIMVNMDLYKQVITQFVHSL
jgi:uncharacterized protein (TIGR00661 family)